MGCKPLTARAQGESAAHLPPQPQAQLVAIKPPPTDTETAIARQLAHLRGLSEEEHEKLGSAFTSPEAVFQALDALDGLATVLLRASWLKQQKSGSLLPKRGDELPPEAVIKVSELRAIHASSTAQTALPIIAISHFWRTKVRTALLLHLLAVTCPDCSSTAYRCSQEHPDPEGETLKVIVAALEIEWAQFAARKVFDLGVLIDWCSLYQEPRTEQQDLVFSTSLKGINQWYAYTRRRLRTIAAVAM